jgi:hypothetical protein
MDFADMRPNDSGVTIYSLTELDRHHIVYAFPGMGKSTLVEKARDKNKFVLDTDDYLGIFFSDSFLTGSWFQGKVAGVYERFMATQLKSLAKQGVHRRVVTNIYDATWDYGAIFLPSNISKHKERVKDRQTKISQYMEEWYDGMLRTLEKDGKEILLTDLYLSDVVKVI